MLNKDRVFQLKIIDILFEMLTRSFDYGFVGFIRQWLNVLLADRRLGMRSPEKLHAIMTSRPAERRLPEGIDPLHVLRRTNLHGALHIRILVHGVCPSAEMVLPYTTRANGIVHSW